MRPPIRLAALMGLHVVHVFTHDSIALGEDGPTHQPVEQLASLRAIPSLMRHSPARRERNRRGLARRLETRDRPVVLVLTRQDVPTLDRSAFAAADGLRRGAYVLSDAPGAEPRADPDRERLGGRADRRRPRRDCWQRGHRRALRLDAELGTVRRATARISRRGACRQRSARGLPSKPACRRAGIATSAIAATCSAWTVSALRRPANVMLREYGFTVDNVVSRAKAVLEKARSRSN